MTEPENPTPDVPEGYVMTESGLVQAPPVTPDASAPDGAAATVTAPPAVTLPSVSQPVTLADIAATTTDTATDTTDAPANPDEAQYADAGPLVGGVTPTVPESVTVHDAPVVEDSEIPSTESESTLERVEDAVKTDAEDLLHHMQGIDLSKHLKSDADVLSSVAADVKECLTLLKTVAADVHDAKGYVLKGMEGVESGPLGKLINTFLPGLVGK